MKVIILIISFAILQVCDCASILASDLTLECPTGQVCYPKCCPLHTVFDVEINECVLLPPIPVKMFHMSTDKNNVPTLTEVQTQTVQPIDNFLLEKLWPFCGEKVKYKSPSKNEVKLLTDNRVYVSNKRRVEIFEQAFCFDTFVNRTQNLKEVSAFFCSPFKPDLQLTSPNKTAESSSLLPPSCAVIFQQMVIQFSNLLYFLVEYVNIA